MPHTAPLPAFFHEINVHTHSRAEGADGRAIVNILPSEEPGALQMFSVGIHPWTADSVSDADWENLARLVADSRCVAVGECGLDRRHRPLIPLEVQLPVFERQALLAERVAKPLIIHSVGTSAEILALHKRLQPSQPWIIHGFRGSEAHARQLTAAGLTLSTSYPAAFPHLTETDSPPNTERNA